jgi:uncharacterized RDD family membrane protein YckC
VDDYPDKTFSLFSLKNTMEDLLAGIQLQTEKARPGIRYIITAIEYFALISPYNLFRPIHSDNKIWGLSFIVIWLFYFPIMEGITGQTLGKRIAKIKVVRKDYSKINFVQAFVRRLFDPIDFFPVFGILGVVLASSTKNNQRIGDLIAGTIVIKETNDSQPLLE